MKRSLVLTGILAGLTMTAVSAEAQRSIGGRFEPAVRAEGPSVSPYAGYMMFGNIVEGPFGTKLTNSSGSVYGAQVNLPLGPVISVVGNVAYAEPDLRFGLPIVGGINFGKSRIWMYDAGLQLSAPQIGGRSIAPFVQVGAGAMSYDVQVAGLSTKATNIAFNAGLGADIPIVDRLSLRVFAKDYIGKFDINEAIGLDYEAEQSHNIALTAGLRFSF